MAVNSAHAQLGSEFDEFPEDPVSLLQRWFELAVARGVREPGALALATVARSGRPSSRMVQLSRITGRGIVFATHSGSRKGIEFEETRCWAGTFYWRETNQQISLAGRVERLGEAEADALWTARPDSANAMSVATRQSERLVDEGELLDRARSLERAGALERPSTWLAYELVADEAEFWQSSPDRLYRRLRYDRAGTGWTVRRLQP